MKRRHFLSLSAATLFASSLSVMAQQRIVFPNGEVIGGQLHWSNGGGDPLRLSMSNALAQPRLNLQPGLQQAILHKMREAPEIIDLRMYNNQVLPGVMMSGDGWLAVNPVIQTSRWQRQNFAARSWFLTWRDASGQVQRWQFIIADVCRNPILIPRGGALPCICNPVLDACV